MEKRTKNCLCGKNGEERPEGGLCKNCYSYYGPLLEKEAMRKAFDEIIKAIDVHLVDLALTNTIISSDCHDLCNLWGQLQKQVKYLKKKILETQLEEMKRGKEIVKIGNIINECRDQITDEVFEKLMEIIVAFEKRSKGRRGC